MLAPLGANSSWNPTSKPVDPTKVCVNYQRGGEPLVSVSRFLALEQASPTQTDTDRGASQLPGHRVAPKGKPRGLSSWASREWAPGSIRWVSAGVLASSTTPDSGHGGQRS